MTKLAWACVALVASAAPAAAQGWIEPLPRVPVESVVKVETNVTVRVAGRVAEVVVDEWFENRGGGLGEGDYVYPVPGEAVFSNFSLYQDEQELRGETMDAATARGIYEEIVRRNRDPALIELMGHGLIRARVFPIEPGQRRRITLRYTQVLERAGESVQFRYAGSRRQVGQGGVVPGGVVPGGVARGDTVPIRFTLIADSAVYGRPFSPTHGLDVEHEAGELRVRPASALTGGLSIFLPITRGLVGMTVATHRDAGEAGYFMLTLSPGSDGPDATPRDVTAVVDVSGSMSGVKMEQTRAALHQLMGSLHSRDRFRLVAFSNRVRTFEDGWTDATPDGLRAARRWIDGLRADGGTNIADALAEALRPGSPDDRLPIVLFLTDGLPTVGERDPERIAAATESSLGRARVFAFGVGYDVNTYLLDRLGAAGRGSTDYVDPDEDVERAVSRITARITHPVLTDLRIHEAPARLLEVYPGELPDLFAGEELVVFGRYEGSGVGRLTLRGRRGDRAATYTIEVGFPPRNATNDYIPRLWASRKLGELVRQIRLSGPEPELVDAVRRTALRYGLLSDYTSYLVQEPGMIGARGARRGLPGGADDGAVSGEAAVRASQRAGALRSVASAADLAVAEEASASNRVRAAPGRPGNAAIVEQRIVAGRTFRLEDGVWTEASRSDTHDTIAVAVYSDAYFEVVRALPELRPVLAALSPVSVAGSRVRIVFDERGERSLSSRGRARLVAAFRGS